MKFYTYSIFTPQGEFKVKVSAKSTLLMTNSRIQLVTEERKYLFRDRFPVGTILWETLTGGMLIQYPDKTKWLINDVKDYQA